MFINTLAGAPVWQEGEDYASTSARQEIAVTMKAPASGGKCSAGAVFIDPGSFLKYSVELPEPIADATVVIRYARLHFRDSMPPARLSVRIEQAGSATEKEISLGDTRGWGTLRGSEYDYVTVPMGTSLSRGPVELTLTAVSPNSNVNIDGFFIAAREFSISKEDTRELDRIVMTGGGYLGLKIPGDTVFPGAFDGFSIVRGGNLPTVQVSAGLQAKDGETFSLVDQAVLSPDMDAGCIPVPGSSLEAYPDGEYVLRIKAGGGMLSLEHPLYMMGKLVQQAQKEAVRYRRLSAALKAEGTQAQKAYVPDLDLAAEYLEMTVDLLLAKQRGEETTSERAAALAYFERSPRRTAKDFAWDIRSIIAQTDASLARLEQDKSPFGGRSGDFRRAFYSDATGVLEPYRIFIPEAYAQMDSIPLIIMLHGGGGDENYFPDLDGGAVKEVLERRPYVMLSPRCTNWYEGPGLKDIKQMIEQTLREFPKVDASRIYCTGVSRGGGGTYRMAMEYPDLFRGIACVSSGPRVTDEVSRLSHIPILLLQGGMDVVAQPERSARSAEELEKRGLTSKRVLFPDYGHEYHGQEYLDLTLDFFEQHLDM